MTVNPSVGLSWQLAASPGCKLWGSEFAKRFLGHSNRHAHSSHRVRSLRSFFAYDIPETGIATARDYEVSELPKPRDSSPLASQMPE
jgi:hypothetical protein